MSLFRDAVIRQERRSLPGTINLALPLSWTLVILALVAIITIIAIFVAIASHARTETAAGTILPDRGILQVVASRPGRVEEVSVTEGQRVARGQILAKVRVEEDDRNGLRSEAAALRSLGEQRASLTDQQTLTSEAASAEQRQYAAQIVGLANELRTLEAQARAQRTLVTMARRDLEQAEEVAARGFISRRDIGLREETLLTREQQALALEQGRAAKSAELASATAAARQARARAAALGASIVRDRARIDRDQADALSGQGYALVAPADGRVAALSIHPGDAIAPASSTMMIVPRGGRLVARLLVPVKASGFMQSGQAVRLAIDAYPFERFGTVDGIVTSVSAAPIMQKDDRGADMPFYVAAATIERPYIVAYGQRRVLLPGMTFTARITTGRRTLLQWLFDPLYAALRS